MARPAPAPPLPADPAGVHDDSRLRDARPLKKAGIAAEYRAVLDEVKEQVEGLALSHSDAATYLTPFGFRTRCLFKMDYAEAEYMARLRSGVKGHFSYRTIAWLMQQAVLTRYPALGTRIAATPPDIEDSLSR